LGYKEFLPKYFVFNSCDLTFLQLSTDYNFISDRKGGGKGRMESTELVQVTAHKVNAGPWILNGTVNQIHQES
jgi:hypothetical protein